MLTAWFANPVAAVVPAFTTPDTKFPSNPPPLLPDVVVWVTVVEPFPSAFPFTETPPFPLAPLVVVV